MKKIYVWVLFIIYDKDGVDHVNLIDIFLTREDLLHYCLDQNIPLKPRGTETEDNGHHYEARVEPVRKHRPRNPAAHRMHLELMSRRREGYV